MLTQRMKVSLITGAILGVVYIVGASIMRDRSYGHER